MTRRDAIKAAIAGAILGRSAKPSTPKFSPPLTPMLQGVSVTPFALSALHNAYFLDDIQYGSANVIVITGDSISCLYRG